MEVANKVARASTVLKKELSLVSAWPPYTERERENLLPIVEFSTRIEKL
jgi:hypothetical protein